MGTVTPERVIHEARTYVGVPFRHQGRDREGIDCIGLPIVVGQTLGLVPANFDAANYSRLPSDALLARMIEICAPLDTARAGTLVMIAWTRTAAHVALCTGETLIHAYQSVGRVVEHGYRGRWVRLTHSAWALPGVTYE